VRELRQQREVESIWLQPEGSQIRNAFDAAQRRDPPVGLRRRDVVDAIEISERCGSHVRRPQTGGRSPGEREIQIGEADDIGGMKGHAAGQGQAVDTRSCEFSSHLGVNVGIGED
jgi:hypothetical protein